MSRTLNGLVVALVLGLAAGLWLGFNPQAHKQVLQDFNGAKTAVAHIGFASTTKAHAAAPAPTAPKSVLQLSPTATVAWRQITTAFESLWTSMQQIWLRATARIR